MRRSLVLIALVILQPAFADPIYRYVDESGRVVLTNIGTARSRVPENAASRVVDPAANVLLSPEETYLPFIEEAARRHNVHPDLVKAIIRVESNFDPDAVSNKGCKGLMQLLPDTARRFGVTNIFDPSENIEGGVKYLRFLLDFFKEDLKLVLAAYNAGENAVTRHKGIPPYRETRDYVKKVTALYTPPAPGLADVASGEPRKANRKIYRIVQPDGRVLFTNTPTDTVAMD